MSHEPVNILLAEDDKVDVMAVKRALRELKICHPPVVASNGIEALDMLRGENGQTRITQPRLILLDLNMPRMGGIEFLEEIRRDPALRSSIVFVMTTSTADEDRRRAYNLNIAGYLVKDCLGKNLLDAISMLKHFWRVVELPTDA